MHAQRKEQKKKETNNEGLDQNAQEAFEQTKKTKALDQNAQEAFEQTKKTKAYNQEMEGFDERAPRREPARAAARRRSPMV